MVSVWVKGDITAALDSNGTVELSDGRTFSLSSIPGNSLNAARLARINTAIQAFVDNRVLLSSLSADDPRKTVDPALPGVYWSDADGNPMSSGATHLTERPARVWIDYAIHPLTGAQMGLTHYASRP